MTIQHQLHLTTSGRGFIDITVTVNKLVEQSDLPIGLCHVFLNHTSASLVLCENADPQVQDDLEAFMQRLVPDGDTLFEHIAEGPDDMPAHVRTILTQNFLVVPITENRLALGTWQGIYLWEHRLGGHKRRVTVTLI